MQDMLTPLLTEYDPIASSEGTLDPCGLYAIADALAVKLAPGVRERQSHPRYLTATAVGAVICSQFEEHEISQDQAVEPWQVFEWYMVEGLVRTFGDSKELRGLPGRDKAARALQDGLHLSPSRYLKTPSVFGFHGVYRLLARTLDVIGSGGLGETGYILATTWEKEQGLSGFYSKEKGPGADKREQLASAVQDGLKKGAVNRGGGWRGWDFFKDHLAPFDCGKKEGKVIIQALVDSESSFRKQVLRFLTSDEGQRIWRETESEKAFHNALRSQVSSDLQELLDAITIYETFARLVQDAFDDCLMLMTKKRGKTTPSELSKSKCVATAADRIPGLFPEVSDRLQPFGETLRFEQAFSSIAEKTSTVAWTELLLKHHQDIQRKKPPNGKNPWFEVFDDDSAIIRSGYRRESGGKNDDSYAHAYRTRPLWSFMEDLSLVSL